MAYQVTIGTREIPYLFYEMGNESFRGAYRKTLRFVCPGDAIKINVLTELLNNTANLQQIPCKDLDTGAEDVFEGYVLKVSAGNETVMISGADPMDPESEDVYAECVVFKLASITKNEKRMIDAGIDPWG